MKRKLTEAEIRAYRELALVAAKLRRAVRRAKNRRKDAKEGGDEQG
ncbi:MAG: hypothetical protein AB1696_19335 [Planctomycetota bacterium]